jgi:hypothetical protein
VHLARWRNLDQYPEVERDTEVVFVTSPECTPQVLRLPDNFSARLSV